MKKRAFLTMLVTGGATWLLAKANSKALREKTLDSSPENTTEGNEKSILNTLPPFKTITPQSYTGLVHKSLEIFTFTTPAMTYHVADPSNLLDELAKEQGITTPFYDIDTCVRGVLSEKGQYGHLGHLDYQLNIVGRCADYDYSKDKDKAHAQPVPASVTGDTTADKAQIEDLEKSLNVGAKS